MSNTVTSKDATRIAYEKSGHGPAVVIVGGVAGDRSQQAPLAALLAHYASHHADPDGKLRARFETVYLTGWSPHESQQQPLKPGSAKARLADALGTREISAGEKAAG